MFNKNGNELTLATKSTDQVENPTPGVWHVVVKEDEPPKLVKDEAFRYTFPKKMYGNVETLGDLAIRRWLNRPKNTGILCSGPQGVGKTMLSQYIIAKAIKDHGAVVIKFSQAHVKKDVFDLIANITAPVVVDIDEFEKLYNWENQMKILTYMSGGSIEGVMWLLTVNNVRQVGTYFFHRPDRIYFHFRYSNVPMDVVESIVTERLKNKKLRKDTLKAIATFSLRTFDTILSFIEEINISKNRPEEVMDYLNIEKSEQTKGGKPKYFYRIYAKKADGTDEDITNEYNREALNKFTRIYDIFGEGGGIEVQPFTEVPLMTASKLYPNNPEFKLDADTYQETEDFRIQRYKIGDSVTGKEVFLEFGKDPYPEPPPKETNDNEPKEGKEALMRHFGEPRYRPTMPSRSMMPPGGLPI